MTGAYGSWYDRPRESKRIDARPKNRWETQAGMRGTHRDTRGNVIGGYAPDGRGLGTKAGNGGGNALGGGLRRWEDMNPLAGKFGEQRGAKAGEILPAPVMAKKAFGPKLPAAAPAPMRSDAGRQVNHFAVKPQPTPIKPQVDVMGMARERAEMKTGAMAVRAAGRRWDQR